MDTNKDKAGLNHKHHRRKKIITTLAIIVALLIIIRIILPYAILRYANNTLHNLSEYTGHIDDIDLHLYRGGAVAKGVVINKIEKEKTSTDTIPFFIGKIIDFSVEWKQLFKGAIVGEVKLEEPVLNIVSGRHKDENLKKDSADVQTIDKKLVPLTINRFDIINGKVRYVDVTSEPKVDVALTEIFLTARNLTNVVDKDKLLPASLNATANAYKGNFSLAVNFNPLKKQPTFELIVDLKNMSLVEFNDFLKAYGNFDVRSGTFSLFSEFAAKNGEFGGYVKPFISDFKITKWKREEKIGEKLWKSLVGAAMNILENPKSDDVATKIPINGNFNDPNINVFRSISLVLRNAFIQALKPSVDNTISVNNLEDETPKTFLEKVFGKKDMDEKKDNKNDKKDNK